MDYLGFGKDMLMERAWNMVESINGHMTRYLETCDRRKKK